MDLQLAGKRALITGSTAGIGYAIAASLAREGAEVILNGRTQEGVDEALGSLLGDTGVLATGYAGDLGTAEACAALAAQHPDVDILVNNLGIFDAKPFEDIPDADWQRFFDVNVMAGVRLSRAFLPGMRARDWGRIVFISSESAINIPAEMVHYGMTKTAQLAVARGLAESLAGTGITVNSVLPGPTRSRGVADFLAKMAANAGQLRRARRNRGLGHLRGQSARQRHHRRRAARGRRHRAQSVLTPSWPRASRSGPACPGF
jgi:NAD(P)-dependent dehydrogenase (short-subunit alcohol dehydrogenase family)